VRKKSLEEQLREQARYADRPRHPIVGVLDNIRSVYNVGAIFRTADAVRLQELVLCGMTARPPRPDIRKTALGAEETVPWRYFESAEEAVRVLKKQGFQIALLEQTDESVDLWEARFDFPLALVVGHEWHGVSEEVLPLADLAVSIPMFGAKTSLNVSVAFGIAAYAALQRWLAKQGQSS